MQIIRPFDLNYADFTTTVPETEAFAWASGTTYPAGAEVIREHQVFVSTVAGNQGNDPLLENQNFTDAKWIRKSATNAYKFIDKTIGSKTVSSSTVTITVSNVAGMRALMLVGMRASTVRVQSRNSGAATVKDETVSLSGRNVSTFYQWFTEPLGEAATKIYLRDFPSDTDNIELTFVGSVIEIGELVIGDILYVGKAMHEGTEGEVKSFTRWEFNAYGELTRIPGPTRTIMRYQSHIPRSAFSNLKDQMDRLAGSIVGAVGSPDRQSTIQVGILGTLRWSEDLPNDYLANFVLDGVT